MTQEDIIRMAREAGMHYRQIADEFCKADTDGVPLEMLERFAALVAAAERNILAAWMIQFGFATGHGDTMEQLVDALGSEIVDRIEIEIDVAVAAEREACAKVCDETLAQHYMKQTIPERDEALFLAACVDCAAAIRARSNT